MPTWCAGSRTCSIVRNSVGERIASVYGTTESTLDTLQLRDGRWFERFSRPQHVDGTIVGRVWSYRDVTARKHAEEALRDEARVLDLLNQTGSAVASTLELDTLLQTVTDAGTQLSGAEFGAFFYNTVGDGCEGFRLYTLSGAPRSTFETLGSPRATPLFGPTFRGEAPVRIDDVLLDPRYGLMAPHHGMPPGHLPVRSYLAVPVKLRSGETIGGLFFGHSTPGAFDARAERIVVGIAAQASIAIDNARVYEEARRVAAEKERLVEIERSARAEGERVSRAQGRVPRHALARAAHAAHRDPRLGQGAAAQARRPGERRERPRCDRQRNAKAQARLIEDLLDMSRIVSGKVRLDLQPTDVAAVVEAAVESVRPQAEAQGASRFASIARRRSTRRSAVDPQPAPAGRLEPPLQRDQVHAARRAHRRRARARRRRTSRSPCATPASASRRSSCRASSTASARPTPRRRARTAGSASAVDRQAAGRAARRDACTRKSDGRGPRRDLHRAPADRRRRAPGERSAGPARAKGVAAAGDVDLGGLRIVVVDDEADARQLVHQLLADRGAEVHAAASAAKGSRLSARSVRTCC